MYKIVDGVQSLMTDQEIEAFKLAQPSESEVLAMKWQQVRETRNQKLFLTDWRASSDLTISDAWKTYRQALRDVPTQSDPDNITWPTEPS